MGPTVARAHGDSRKSARFWRERLLVSHSVGSSEVSCPN